MIEPELTTKEVKELFRVITALRTEEECRDFLRDLCTFSELKAMTERWQVVKRVNQKTPYRIIAEKTGASTATITRVAHWLHHGTGGYRLALDRIS